MQGLGSMFLLWGVGVSGQGLGFGDGGLAAPYTLF